MKEWPVHYKERLAIQDPESNVAVCCLWSPQKSIVRKLGDCKVSVIGNLYSLQGINYLIRNILAKPTITHLVICGHDLTGSGAALWSLLQNQGKPDFIDNGIDIKTLNLVRRNVTPHLFLEGGSLGFKPSMIEAMKGHSEPWSDPIELPIPRAKAEQLPSHEVVEVVREPKFYDAWLRALKTIMAFGNISPTQYGDRQREIINMTIVTDEPTEEVDLSLFDIDQHEFDSYVNSLLFGRHGANVSYTYGSRFTKDFGINQLSAITQTLQDNYDSRRAVACTWKASSDGFSKNPPCLILIHAMVRGGLIMTCYIRSNDMYRAWPLNALALRRVQEIIAQDVGVATGTLTIISGSAHVYEPCWIEANKRIESDKSKYAFKVDPRGSFVIKVKEGQIIVEHFSPEGLKCSEFTVKRSADAKRKMMPMISSVAHALYIGRELERAQNALDQGLEYNNQ